jgi:hypothetical protein
MLLYTPCRDAEQQARLQTLMVPIVKSLLFKCADSNRFVSDISYLLISNVMLSSCSPMTVVGSLTQAYMYVTFAAALWFLHIDY